MNVSRIKNLPRPSSAKAAAQEPVETERDEMQAIWGQGQLSAIVENRTLI